MSGHKYKLKYEFTHEVGEFTEEEVRKSGLGATDAILTFSCIYPSDGTLSVLHNSVDGRNGGKPLSSQELFKLWMMIGRNISEREDLDEVKRGLAAFPIDTFFKVVMKGGEQCGTTGCGGDHPDHDISKKV